MITKNRDIDFLQQLINWNTKNIHPPQKITIFPTALCSTHCLFCPRPGNAHENYKEEVQSKRWKEIAKEGVELGIKEWEISGGGEEFEVRFVTTPDGEVLRLWCDCFWGRNNFN